jgi:hypothetical protein
MNNSALALLLAAAGTGLMGGTVAPQQIPVPVQNGRTQAMAGLGQTPGSLAQAPAKHSCKGQNSCKGQGGCNTGDMGCKGKNSCKGKGGCSTM